MKTKDLATTSIFATLYVVIGLSVPMISFGVFQCRLSDVLYPLISVFGFPSLLGCALGHGIYNIYGYTINAALGPLDVIVSPLLFLIPKYLIYKYGLKATPIHVLFVALWIPYLLLTLFGVPYWMAVLSVGGGETIAEVVLGVPLTLAVKKRFKQ